MITRSIGVTAATALLMVGIAITDTVTVQTRQKHLLQHPLNDVVTREYDDLVVGGGGIGGRSRRTNRATSRSSSSSTSSSTIRNIIIIAPPAEGMLTYDQACVELTAVGEVGTPRLGRHVVHR